MLFHPAKVPSIGCDFLSDFALPVAVVFENLGSPVTQVPNEAQEIADMLT